jgi:RNA polymerase sigma factor (sigma-70 family)
MVPTTSLATFIAQNDSELRSLTNNICNRFNYPGDFEDVVQEMYLKLLTNPIIENFKENRIVFNQKKKIKTHVKMSTYIYPIIRNHILSTMKSRESKIINHQLPDCEPLAENICEQDSIIRHTPLDVDYQTLIMSNESSDCVDGPAASLHDFEQSLLQAHKNKKFSLNKRKNKDIKTTGCTLLDILRYLYDGYNNNEIAKIYGVTDMSITNMKQKLTKEMLKFGFGTRERIIPAPVVVKKDLKNQIIKALEGYNSDGFWVELARLLSEARDVGEDISFTGLKNNANRMISAYKFLKVWRPGVLTTPRRILAHFRAISPLQLLHDRLPDNQKDRIDSLLDKILKNKIPAYIVERYATTLVDEAKKKMPDYVYKKHLKNLK